MYESLRDMLPGAPFHGEAPHRKDVEEKIMTIWQKLRIKSFSELFQWLKGRIWYTHILLLLRRPAGKPLDESLRKPCRGTIRAVTEAELGDCGDFENAGREVPYLRLFLRRGDLVRFGYLDGRCVYRSCVQREGPVPFSKHIPLTLGPKEVHVFHVYCAPNARGSGLHAEDLWQLCGEYPDTAFYACVLPSNIPSLRNFYRAGYEPYALLSAKHRFFLYLGYRKKLLSPEEAEAYLRQAEGASPGP